MQISNVPLQHEGDCSAGHYLNIRNGHEEPVKKERLGELEIKGNDRIIQTNAL